MNIKIITIYLPDGNNSSYQVKKELISIVNGEKKETGVFVNKIEIDKKNKDIKIYLSNKEVIVFHEMKYSYSS